MQSVKANVVSTECAMASAFRTMSVRVLFLPDAECQGKCPPDDTCHGIYLPAAARHGICLPDEECQGIIASGHRVSRQMSSGGCVLGHLPSGRGVSAYYSFWTPSVKANVVQTRQAKACASWTMRATASAFGTKSVSALFLPDTECQGKCSPEGMCHGICLPKEEC